MELSEKLPSEKLTEGVSGKWKRILHPGYLGGISLLAFIPLLIWIGFLTGTLSVKTVFARGETEIIATDPQIVVVFSEAATDDPVRTLDPGFDQDVATCRARVRVQGGSSLSLTILNGYPGYICTLQATLVNRGPGAVRLDRLEYEVPPGLEILGPEYAEPLILAPGQRGQQNFAVMVAEDAEQGETHAFHIWQVFTPGD